jgi:hypothetical protein
MCSILFLIYVVVLLLFFITQYESDFVTLEKPQPGESSYGTKYSNDPEIIEPSAINSLYGEFVSNSYEAYPIGFYKNVKLNDAQQREMAGILSTLTGISEDQFLSADGDSSSDLSFNGEDIIMSGDGSFSIKTAEEEEENGDIIDSVKITRGEDMIMSGDGSFSIKTEEEENGDIIDPVKITIRQDLTYEQFHALMRQADSLIGGGSKYGDTYLSRFGGVPKTYEDALKEYNDIVVKDRITGAYARYFCDYLGIVLSIFPVFLAVANGMKDRRAQMCELVYSRKISSAKIVLTRYSALLITMFLPVILLAIYATIQTAAGYPGFTLDLSAFVKYSICWLLPTVMVSTAIGVFITELTNTPLAIVVQGIWWFLGLTTGIRHIGGGYGWDLIPRHNVVGNTQVYLDSFFILLRNRIGYAIFASILILITIWVYERKRKGKGNAYFNKNSLHRRVKSAA